MINKYRIYLSMEDNRGYKWGNSDVTIWCTDKTHAEKGAKLYRDYLNERHDSEKVVGYKVHLEY